MQRTKILGVSGSPAAVSRSKQALQAVLDRLAADGFTAELCDLTKWHLPPYRIGDDDRGRVETFTRQVVEADGIILASPVYHGAVSGLLKNALDHLPGTAFHEKPVGLVVATGGLVAAGPVLESMMNIVRTMHGWNLPTHLAVSKEHFDEDRILQPHLIQDRVDRLAQTLARAVRALTVTAEKQETG